MNEENKRKAIILTFIGALTLLFVVVGGTFAYFQLVDTNNGKTQTDLNANTEGLDTYGNSYLNQGSSNLHIRLSASDMGYGKRTTKYWATTTDEDYQNNAGNHVISTVGISGGNNDTIYKCTSDLLVTATGTMVTDKVSIEDEDGKIIFGSSTDTYGNSLVIDPTEATLKALIDAQSEGGYKKQIEYTIVGNSKIELTTDIVIENRDKEQNYLSGKNININITNSNLSCEVSKTNITPPGEFDMYVKEESAKYTKDTTNLVYIKYSEEDVDSYCITEEETSNECVWTKIESGDKESKLINGRYEFKDESEGEKHIRVFLKDTGNNISEPQEYTITLDTKAPGFIEDNLVLTSSEPTKVTATINNVTDNYSEVEYCFRNGEDGEFECGTSNTKEYTVTEGSTNNIYAYVKDKAGNESSTLNKTITTTEKPKSTKEILEEDAGSSLKADVGGMYRYQGTDNVANWILFGTKEECNKDEEGKCTNLNNITYDDYVDKYMYRIIGITPEGQLYLLKETFLKEGDVTGFAWNDECKISGSDADLCPNGVCPEWNEADLFQRINGTANGTKAGKGDNNDGKDNDTDIFVDSTYYDYLKSGDNVNGGEEASDWYKLIDTHSWYYGDTTTTNQYDGNTLYAIETGNVPTTHYAKGEDGTVSSQPTTWNKEEDYVTAKISLMYIHDVAYAYPSAWPTSSTKVKNSWIHYLKDGYNSSSLNEWLSTRWGIGYLDTPNVGAWYLNFNGTLAGNANCFISSFGVRPVFYLTSEAKITGGEGTKSSPYILSWN